MKKNIIFTLFGIMCATGAVTTDSIAACDVCATAGLNEAQDTKSALPWDDTSSNNGQYAHQLVFWENCSKHQNETISYYKCEATNNGKCIYGTATVDTTGAYGAYPARIDNAANDHLICCDAPAGRTGEWKQMTYTADWTGKDRTGCAKVIAAEDCTINNDAPIFRAGDHFSSTSCLDTAADTEEQSPTETYTRPANCPQSANTCLTNVHTDARLYADTQGAMAAWNSNARRSYPERRVMYWSDCGTTCFESYGCQTHDGRTTNDKTFIYAPLHRDQNTGLYEGEGAYAYKIINSSAPNRYELLYCDASQNKWIKLDKAAAGTNTSSYQPITVGTQTLYVSSAENISAATLWSTRNSAPTQDEISEEEQNEQIAEECEDDYAKIHAINKAMKTLNAFNYTDDTSVWTTAEGKFNTARLGTDIASGIAMGLTGGLVSNVIIKNKQIKQGFQGYQCTVDSNIIADYGDEFVIDLAY